MTDPSLSTPCPRCGNGISAGSRFCANCGESLTGEIAAGPAVGSAGAHEGRLSDSGGIELKTMLGAATPGDYEIQDELGRGGMAGGLQGPPVRPTPARPHKNPPPQPPL